MERPRIFYLYRRLIPQDCITDVLFHGGAQKIIVQLAENFSKKGWDVHFGSDDQATTRVIRFLMRKEVRVHHVPFCSRASGFFKSLLKIRSVIQNFKIDVLHCNDRWTLALGVIAAWGTGVHVVYSAHNVFTDKHITRFFLGKNIIAVSKGVEENLRDYFNVPKTHIQVIYNGVAIDQSSEQQRSTVIRKWRLSPQDRVIAFIGRLSKQKGLEILIQAVLLLHSKFPSLRILLVGDGKGRLPLTAAVVTAKLQEVFIFCGHQDNVSPFIDISEFIVMPSLWEGLGISAIEALMLGKAVVATSVGGLVEVIESGENGYLVQPNDPQSLAEHISLLLNNPERTRAMGLYGRKIAKEKFSLPEMMYNYENYYSDLLDEKNASKGNG